VLPLRSGIAFLLLPWARQGLERRAGQEHR
jgi:hypothetical protein